MLYTVGVDPSVMLYTDGMDPAVKNVRSLTNSIDIGEKLLFLTDSVDPLA
jgi:hypothetical protein